MCDKAFGRSGSLNIHIFIYHSNNN